MGLAKDELSDDFFEHQCRLSQNDLTAVLENLLAAARVQTDILLSEQPRREYLGKSIIGNLVELRVDSAKPRG